MNGEATRFQIGNKEAEKWTIGTVREIFMKMLKNAKEVETILCLQDAILSVDLYSSSLNYLVEKFPVFENIKKDVQDIILSRINKGALTGTYVASPSIWRMKQLGEAEKQEFNHLNNGGTFTGETKVTFHKFKKEDEKDEKEGE